MTTPQSPEISQLESTLQALSFIHQKLTTVQYFPEEFKQADVALKMIIEMAHRVSKDLHNQNQAKQEPVKKQRKTRKSTVSEVVNVQG